MGRGATTNLILLLTRSLRSGQKSITDITGETGLDRSAVVRYLEILRDAGLLMEEQSGNSKVFTLVPNYREDTYFGLPLDDATTKQIGALYHLIAKEWTAQTGRKLLKTNAQKIIYDVINQQKLTVPIARYLYGGICLMPYDEGKTYASGGLTRGISAAVADSVTEYAKRPLACQSKDKQYMDYPDALYDLKELILKIIYSDLSKESLKDLQKEYARFIMLVPDGDKDYKELVSDYLTLIIDFANHWAEPDWESRKLLVTSFEALWKLVALYRFKADMRAYYSEDLLERFMRLNIEQAKGELIELGTEFQERVQTPEPEDALYKEIKKALSSVKRRPAGSKPSKKEVEVFLRSLKKH